MTRRITCYVVFITLLWSAHTENEENIRNAFQSNMTRNDFSNLLKSLIQLNEQRVNVLQKLYKLEDYGVLSEVLRSGQKKTKNGNPKNLFLIVMSKNYTDPQRKHFQIVDSVGSLDVGNHVTDLKLEYVLDPASIISQNIQKGNPLESIFEDIPNVYDLKQTHQIGDQRENSITTATNPLKRYEPDLKMELKHHKQGLRMELKHDIPGKKIELKHNKPGQKIELKHNKPVQKIELKHNKPVQKIERKHHKPGQKMKLKHHKPHQNMELKHPSDKSRAKKTTLKTKANQKRNKNSRFIIVSNTPRYSNASQILLDNDDNIIHSDLKYTTVHNKHTSFTEKYPSKNQDEQDESYYGFPYSAKIESDNRKFTKINNEISIKKYHGTKHTNLKKHKKDKSMINFERNHYPELNRIKSNEDSQGNNNSKVTKSAIKTTTHRKKAEENNQTNENSNFKANNTHANKLDLIYSIIKHKNATKQNEFLSLASKSGGINPNTTKDSPNRFSVEEPINFADLRDNSNKKEESFYDGDEEFLSDKDHGNKLPPLVTMSGQLGKTIPTDSPHKEYHGSEQPKHVKDDSNKFKPNTVTDLHNKDNHTKDKNKKETIINDVKSGDKFSVFVTNVKREKRNEKEVFNKPKNQKLNLDTHNNPESKPIIRKAFQKCLNKKATKLCTRSCIRAYRLVCRRLKCTSKAKRALKTECKRSCKRTFKSSSSKYSKEDSYESYSDDDDDDYYDSGSYE